MPKPLPSLITSPRHLAEWDIEQIEQTLQSISDEHSPEELGFDPDALQEAFDELSGVDEAVGKMRNAPVKKEKAEPTSGLVKILLLPTGDRNCREGVTRCTDAVTR